MVSIIQIGEVQKGVVNATEIFFWHLTTIAARLLDITTFEIEIDGIEWKDRD